MTEKIRSMVICRSKDPLAKPFTIRWEKFLAIRNAIYRSTPAEGDGIPYGYLMDEIEDLLTPEERALFPTRGSLEWHVKTVKTEMEVNGDLERLPSHPLETFHRIRRVIRKGRKPRGYPPEMLCKPE